MSSVAGLPHVYRYPFESHLDGSRLAVAPELRAAPDPWFFRGTLAEPHRVAELLLVLHDVVRTRFFRPLDPASLDPVLTANEGVLRVEGFSSCASVYARVDLPEEAVRATIARRGTTNVDFGRPMRAALNQIRPADQVELAIGREAVRLSSGSGSVVERKVTLPLRWIKGFSETALIGARLTPTATLEGPDILRALRSFPRRAPARFAAHLVPSGRGVRLSTEPAPGGVTVRGIDRLRLLERVAPNARRLRISTDEATGATHWRLETSTASLTLLLSPDLDRGFSGEGQALEHLAGDWEQALPRVRAALRWQARLDPRALGTEHGLAPERVQGALAALGSRGLVGYDADAGAYFHRELPFDLERVDELHPRLRDARQIVAEGGVRIEERDGERVRGWVRGSQVEHHARLELDGDKCTCEWWARHQGERGPCKHVLALQIATEGA